MFEPLSDFIRLRRKQLNLTQEMLARKAKVSRRQLCLFETGHNVSLAFLVKVADALEISEIPVGRRRPVPAWSELVQLWRAAEVFQVLRRAGNSWKGAAGRIGDSAEAVAALIDAASHDPASWEQVLAVCGEEKEP